MPLLLSRCSIVRVLCAVACVLALVSGDVVAQQIANIQWGLDGTIKSATYNLLTVDVTNPTSEPWDDALVLTRSSGVSRIGLPHAQKVFLAPGQSRRVQFHVYVSDTSESWSLQWAAGQIQSASAPMAQEGQDAMVLLVGDDDFSKGIRGVPQFPASAWPTSVVVLDGLRDVIVDHVPDMDGPRRHAFLDWIRRGGRLHVLRDPAERSLQFGQGFEELDAPPTVQLPSYDRLAIGAGDVIRYPLGRRGIDKGGLRRVGLEFDALEQRARESVDQQAETFRSDSFILGSLRALVRADHSWALILFLAMIFLLLVGPAHWLLSRQRPETKRVAAAARRQLVLGWRGSIVYLVGVVALFTWLFLKVGARGYGEATRMDTMALAMHIGDGRWDVDAITNLFVTSGDLYKVAVPGEQGVVSAGPVREPVRGAAHSGRDAYLDLDVPLFSSRPFVRRSVIELGGPTVRIDGWDDLDGATGAIEGLPPNVRHLFWIEGKQGRVMVSVVDSGSLHGSDAKDLADTVQRTLSTQGEFLSYGLPGVPQQLAESGMELTHAWGMVVDAMRWHVSEQRDAFAKSKNAVLMVVADLPDAAKVTGSDISESGTCVYLLPVRRPNP